MKATAPSKKAEKAEAGFQKRGLMYAMSFVYNIVQVPTSSNRHQPPTETRGIVAHQEGSLRAFPRRTYFS